MGRRWYTGLGGLLLWLSAVAPAGAHSLGASRLETPIPLSLLYAGAGATVAITAGWLGSTRNPGFTRVAPRTIASLPPSVATVARTGGRIGFFVAFVGVLAAGLTGPSGWTRNFATIFVWPLWLKGVGLFAILFGSPWRILSPWRTLYRGLVALEGRDLSLAERYPEKLGEWPALVGFLVWIGIVENLTQIPRLPAGTAAVVAVYAIVMVLGGVVFGEQWFDRADALAVLYRLFGRAAPIRPDRTRDGGYEFALRAPWRGATSAIPSFVLVGFVVATVYTVSFDGFTYTPEYQTLLFAVRDITESGPQVSILVYLCGLLLFVVSFFGVAYAVASIGGGDDWRAAAKALAPTVIPIAVAYEFVHNYPYVLDYTGRLLTVLVDPLLAGPETISLTGWLSVQLLWVSQIVLIVGGHVIAVVAAHWVTTDRYPDRRRALYAHVPVTALMIGYTILSLWIISRPVAA
ncbi:hypothetical protein DMJ13_09730 [halophilic archaeon]|nr:hypothetical protein DMJ13_09730 [halophilic archaeon]